VPEHLHALLDGIGRAVAGGAGPRRRGRAVRRQARAAEVAEDLVAQLRMEVGGPQADAAVPEAEIDPALIAARLLRLQVRVAAEGERAGGVEAEQLGLAGVLDPGPG